ncbi:heterokaryon incompatibility protein-domain-containing protein [Pyrenochaeta sp. MPI-SDFR-AT-0127]|nr:heterokaryon incompatibility protein-domain-containing protein [Pyrenochaeta sp. MPI-SDFR-AT-0127]
MRTPTDSGVGKWPHPQLVGNLRRTTSVTEETPPNAENPTLDELEKDNGDFCTSCITNILDLGSKPSGLNDKRASDVQFDMLERSANAGCCLCGPLLRDYSKLGLGSAEFKTIMFQGTKKDISIYIQTHSVVNKSLSTIPVSVMRKLQDLDEIEPKSLISSSLMSDNTNSEACWSQVETWYQDCVANHPTCALSSQSSSWYPSRLLDVGTDSHSKIRLCITAETKIESPYATLSHCWGNAKIPRLELAKRNSFEQGILLEDLPETFKNAVLATRRLGIRYLWIDSLCIIQDCVEDWRYEASMMANVYLNGCINISAGASSDSHGGLFRSRDPATLRRRYATGDLIGEPGKKFLVVEPYVWVRRVLDSPVNQRAWVLQERLLAPRTIHYSSPELFWECRQCSLSESYPRMPAPKTINSYPMKWCNFPQIETINATDNTFTNASLDHKTIFRMWNEWIDKYMRCGITIPSDRLVAISGLAQQTMTVLEDTYLAGLWRSILPAQLLWYSDGCKRVDGQAAHRPAVYRAPSWSWAAIESDIRTSAPTSVGELIEIEAASVTPLVEGDTTGRVTDGFIKLMGILSGPASVSKSFDSSHGWFDLLLGNVHLGQKVYLDVHPPTEQQEVCDLQCLPVRLTRGSTGAIVEGLLLEQAVDHSDEYYRRVGYFMAYGEHAMTFAPAILRMASRVKEGILIYPELVSSIVLI